MSEREIHAILQTNDLYAILQISTDFKEEQLKKSYKKVK
jgi:hypothetical protein